MVVFCMPTKKGVEELFTVLNMHFERIIQAIDGFGGDVIKFAGDALLVVWRVLEEDKGPGILARESRKVPCVFLKIHKFADHSQDFFYSLEHRRQNVH